MIPMYSIVNRFTLTLCLLLSAFSSYAERQAPSDSLSIVTLSPQGTELAFAAGLGDYIVGVSEHSDYPPAALDIERIANHRGINLERVITLNPDIILAWEGGNPAQQLFKLRQLGYNVINTYPNQLTDIGDIIDELSEYSLVPEQGKEAATNFRQELSTLRERYKDADEVSFFYQLSTTPLMTMNSASWPGPVFDICQGKNIFAESRVPYPQVNQEQVIMRQPDVIFLPHGQEINDTVWQRWEGKLPAVDNQRIVSLNSDWLTRATPRSLKAAQEICAYLHE